MRYFFVLLAVAISVPLLLAQDDKARVKAARDLGKRLHKNWSHV